MPRPSALSGFPEWLPAQRIAEQLVLDSLRATFELYGFSPVETRAVEPLDQLLRKGETSKEVYVLRRLQADADGGDAGLGLHFDLTVPFARYVLENSGKLLFPFRRYQIQRAWRGERPQEGRFREFTQADVDVVGTDELPFTHDVELPLVVLAAFAALPLPPFVMQVNNRKLVQGFCTAIGVADYPAALRAVDKLDKAGPGGVRAELTGAAGCTPEQADALLGLAAVSGDADTVSAAVAATGASDPLLEQGLAELVAVLTAAQDAAPGRVVADLSITRGLDYYTGTVYETRLVGHESIGSICSGGRYDDLVSSGKTRHPGVGLSVGVSRLLSRLFAPGLLAASRPTPTCVLVAVTDEATRARSLRVASALRARGIPTEVSPTAARFGRQIRAADRAGIPFVWFAAAGVPAGDGAAGLPADPGGGGVPTARDQVKDIRSGDQVDADATDWLPPAGDLHPHLVATRPDPAVVPSGDAACVTPPG